MWKYKVRFVQQLVVLDLIMSWFIELRTCPNGVHLNVKKIGFLCISSQNVYTDVDRKSVLATPLTEHQACLKGLVMRNFSFLLFLLTQSLHIQEYLQDLCHLWVWFWNLWGFLQTFFLHCGLPCNFLLRAGYDVSDEKNQGKRVLRMSF